MSNALVPVKSDESRGELIQLVSFNLDQEEYGVDVLKVREIIRMPIVTRVPNTPHFVEGVVCAAIKASTTFLGESRNIAVSAGTGQATSRPSNGSRMMELANVDAALLGFPGRTTTVGKRSDRPSTKPRRL